MMHCIFIPGSPKSTFSKYSFGREGVTKKEYSLYAFDNVDNYGRPLRVHPELSSFSRTYTMSAGRHGVKGRCTLFFKFCSWCIAILRRGLRINIFKVFFC